MAKVETIGDAYMAASGHDGRKDHCMALMRMACAMLDAVTTIRYSPTEATLMGR
jgi:hypothetical protein